MRVTQGMMTNQILQNITQGYGRVADSQNQLASGKKITRPSQDPIVATMGISYRTDVGHVEQYRKNVTTAYKWLDSSDDALQQTDDVLNRIRELTVEASNGTHTAEQRQAIGTEVAELKQQLVTIGNTQVGGQYIFSGSDTANPPLVTGNDGTVTLRPDALSHPDLAVDVNDGISVSVNIAPDSVFSEDLFSDLDRLIGDLNNGNADEAAIGAHLGELDTHLDEVARAQAELGAKTNRVDMISNRLNQQKTIATKIMSNNEDVDYAETIIQLNQQQNIYNASLAVGARIIQTSLLDFLK
ncbi:flagellar hook-associated protein FlgL [Sporolactobacillus sp. Y61]|uniref:Flagellar hook-associated protein FlgL n=1 Tax=Sporolactobacillus sp. Y61 TaxID=3160863 RepID=A0AAU8IB09_9BACL